MMALRPLSMRPATPIANDSIAMYLGLGITAQKVYTADWLIAIRIPRKIIIRQVIQKQRSAETLEVSWIIKGTKIIIIAWMKKQTLIFKNSVPLSEYIIQIRTTITMTPLIANETIKLIG